MLIASVFIFYAITWYACAGKEIHGKKSFYIPSHISGFNDEDIKYILKDGKVLQMISNAAGAMFGGKEMTASLFQNVSMISQLLRSALTSNSKIDAELKLPKSAAPCLLTIGKMIIDMKRNPSSIITSPLFRMFDASGKIPSGVLSGNLIWAGNYRGCIETPGAHHCLNHMELVPNFPFIHGICLPEQCTAENAEAAFKFLSRPLREAIGKATNKTVEAGLMACNEKEVEYTSGAKISIVVMGLILFCCVVGTALDVALGDKEESTSMGTLPSEVITNDYAVEATENGEIASVDSSEIDKRSHSIAPIIVKNRNARAAKSNGSMFVNIMTSFSLSKNTSAIFSTDVPPGAITSINGIRFISMSWVILGHYYAFVVVQGKPDNVFDTFKVVKRFTALPLTNAYFSVDSFFLLSGLLVSYLTLKKISKGSRFGFKEIMMMYLHRYIRLTPTLGVVILFSTYVQPLLFTGPFSTFFRRQAIRYNPCYDHWWTTLLYINNFYGKDCIGWTWYLANDMQFYILAPGILMLIMFVEKKSDGSRSTLRVLGLIGLMCLVSIVITGTIYGYLDISSLKTASSFAGNPRAKNAWMEMDMIYTKPYTRITPYLVGIFLGYLFNRNDITLKGGSGRLVAAIGWIVAIVLALLVVYGPWKVYKDASFFPSGVPGTFLSTEENIMYGACHRFVWSCALAWVIFACHNKFGGLVDKILSWRAWIPLSRLTYSAYNVHLLVMQYFMVTREVPPHFQDNQAISGFISCVVFSYAAAFVLSVCVEFPVMNIEKILFKI